MYSINCSRQLVLWLFVLLVLSACGKRGAQPAEPIDDVTQEVPIEKIPEASADQVEALTDTVPLDSTDWVRDFQRADTYIYISKPKMRLYVVNHNDSVLFSCGIACGLRRGDKQEKDDYRTPEGNFRISGMYESIDWIHKTRDGREVKGCYGPYFLRLATGRFSGIGIHGTNAPGSIGRRASEGCIRVNSQNIVVLHDHYAFEGMPVIVSAERERLPEFLGLGQEPRNAAQWEERRLADSLHHSLQPEATEGDASSSDGINEHSDSSLHSSDRHSHSASSADSSHTSPD